MSDPFRDGQGVDNAPQDPFDDVVHGLLVAHASESVGATVGHTGARTTARAGRRVVALPMGPLAAILLFAVTLGILIPLALNPSTANASAVIGSAEAALAESGSRTYEIRVTRWGGPAANRMMVGEITHVAGEQPHAIGYLELDESGKRIEFGRDAQGVWFKGPDGQVRRRDANEAPHADVGPGGARRDDHQRAEERRAAAGGPGAASGQGAGANGRPFTLPIDLDWMTLDSVLPKLRHGYDLQVVEYPRWRTLIARRQWMPNGLDAKALDEARQRASALRQGTQPDGESGATAGSPDRAGPPPAAGGDATNAEGQEGQAARRAKAAGPVMRGAPLRVELEFAPDGRVIERARIELDSPRSPRTIELRLKLPGEPTAEADDVDLGSWE